MAPDYVVKAGTRPQPLTATLTDAAGAAIDLTNVTAVTFLMRALWSDTALSKEAERLTPHNQGKVSVQLDEEDLVPGFYHGEWLVLFTDTTKERFPVDDTKPYLEILIYGSLS